MFHFCFDPLVKLNIYMLACIIDGDYCLVHLFPSFDLTHMLVLDNVSMFCQK